eukprot:6175816-Pleurochrysis_carterae.AAC.1
MEQQIRSESSPLKLCTRARSARAPTPLPKKNETNKELVVSKFGPKPDRTHTPSLCSNMFTSVSTQPEPHPKI